jgi:hypothetical protein
MGIGVGLRDDEQDVRMIEKKEMILKDGKKNKKDSRRGGRWIRRMMMEKGEGG